MMVVQKGGRGGLSKLDCDCFNLINLVLCLSTSECMYVCMHVEAKIYSRTDTFSNPRLQRSKHGSSCARSSEQQDMVLG